MAIAEPYQLETPRCCVMSIAEDISDPKRKPPVELSIMQCHYGHVPVHHLIWSGGMWQPLWPQADNEIVLPGPVTCQQCNRTYLLSERSDFYTRHSDGLKVCEQCLIGVLPVTPVQPALPRLHVVGPDLT